MRGLEPQRFAEITGWWKMCLIVVTVAKIATAQNRPTKADKT
jgi:hypothetical protein